MIARKLFDFFIHVFLAFSFMLLFTVENSFAQQTLGETDIETYSFSGNIGLQTHAYTTTQEFDRREPLGALLTANAEYSLLGFSSGLDLRYSTDDNDLRQNMNRIQFNGAWRWIALSAGDVNPSYSEYGLRGTQIRGGELRLSPGAIFLNLSAGRINRAVRPSQQRGARQAAYERRIYGIAFGAGSPSATNVGISGFLGRDIRASLADSTRAALSGSGVVASENVGLTPKFQLSFFEESVKIGAETTVSAFTRDLESPKLSAGQAGVPKFLVDLFAPRNSTRVTYAGKAHTALSFDLFSLRAGFERIMPGFESMGLRQLRDDQQTLTLQPAFNLFEGRWSIDGTLMISEDNLLGQRLSTQNRSNIAVNTNARLTEALSLGGGYSRFESYSRADGARDHEQLSQIYQLFPSVSFFRGGISHSITLTGVYQQIDVRFPTEGGSELSESYTLSGGASYGISFAGGLSLNNSLNYVSGESPGNTFTNLGASLGAGYSMLEGTLSVNLTLNAALNTFESEMGTGLVKTENGQLNGNLVASYRLSSSTSFQLSLRTQNNTVMSGEGQDFSELEGRFKFQQRF